MIIASLLVCMMQEQRTSNILSYAHFRSGHFFMQVNALIFIEWNSYVSICQFKTMYLCDDANIDR